MSLPPPFMAPTGQRIGEVWFEPPRGFAQLLVKYIFTSEALSVQVHPSDAQRPGQGKEECWLIVATEPGARIGVGFRAAVSPQAIRAAALDGTIEGMLGWYEVRPGDFFYIPAGTVHAIGAGVSLIEVQQNSDVTYRLYDYGRPRELHLDQGVAVARGEPHLESLRRHVPAAGNVPLCDGPPFRLERIDGNPGAQSLARFGEGLVLVIPSGGEVRIGGELVVPGQCAVASSLAAIACNGTALIAQPS
jgi:mannose-6-phosphate isomerase